MNTKPKEQKDTIAFTQGKKAAEMGLNLKDTAIANLHPSSERYEQFIAGFDSVSTH